MTTIDQRSIVENLTFYDRQNIIWDCNCNPTEKLVLLALNSHADSNGECFPGLKRIEQKCRISRADRVTDRLTEMGLIVKHQRFDSKGRQTSNGYQILFSKIIEMDRESRGMDRESRGMDRESRGMDRESRGMDRESRGRWIENPGGDGSRIQGEVDRESIKLDHIELDQNKNSELIHSDPDRVREKCNSEFEPEGSRFDESVKPIALVPPERIGEGRFSAASLNSSVEGFPIGPWGRDLFSIHPGFMAAVIAKWRKGDTQKAKTFGSMVDEEVRGCILKYWRKDWANLQLDWTEYEESTKRLAQTVRDRMAQGVEINSQEQKILTDRVMGPEHLRPAIAHSASQQPSLIPAQVQRQGTATIGALPVALTEISESQLEETRRAIESARASIAPIALSAQLFSGREPVPEFLAWLEPRIEANKIPGLSRRQTAIALARRPEMQKAFLESQDNQPHEDF